MICWDRTDHLVVGAFKPIHLRWLRAQLTGFRDLVDWRIKQYRPAGFGNANAARYLVDCGFWPLRQILQRRLDAGL